MSESIRRKYGWEDDWRMGTGREAQKTWKTCKQTLGNLQGLFIIIMLE